MCCLCVKSGRDRILFLQRGGFSVKLLLRAMFYPVSFFVEGGLLRTNRFTNCSLIMVCRGIVVDSGKFLLGSFRWFQSLRQFVEFTDSI